MPDLRPIIVTGASRGIGLELVRQLLASGKSVIGVARQRPELPDTPAFRFIACDLSDPRAVADLTTQLRQFTPGGLINNAAIQTEADLALLPPDEIARCVRSEIDLDLVAPMILSFGLLAEIAKAPGGYICNINSGLALAPKMAAPAYCASKAGLANATLALRGRARAWPGLLISEVIMPLVDTDMTAGRGSGKITARDAAAAVLRGLGRQQPEIWVGKARLLRVLWSFAPGRTSRMMLGDVPGSQS